MFSRRVKQLLRANCQIRSAFAIFFSVVLNFLLNPVEVQANVSGPKDSRIARVGEWLAFGSGCRGAANQEQGNVIFKNTYGKSILGQFFTKSFTLDLKEGSQGVRECAFRMTIEPPPDVRIRHVQARIQVEATKTKTTHLRSRVLLLVGENTVASKTWDLSKETFARMRSEEIVLTPGERTNMSLPKFECGRPQIIGMDVTFEGKSDGKPEVIVNESQDSYLRPVNKTPAEIEVFFEECKK